MTGRVRGTIAAVALGGVLALTGCGTNDTAAVVDGNRISASDAATGAQQINKQFPPDVASGGSALTTANAVGLLIYAPTIIAFAAETGHPQSSDAARSQLTAIQEPNPATIEMVQANNALRSLDQSNITEVLKRIRALKVSVNPRYGTFDAANAKLVAVPGPWISTSGT
ncbi:MAG: hypothetical protein ABI131_01895 [Nostocoides sp.]